MTQNSTYKELEFDAVLQQIASHLYNEDSEKRFLEKKYISESEIITELHAVSEYNASFSNENPIQFSPFETIFDELKTMQIEGYVLSTASFNRIKKLCISFQDLQKSLQKFEEYYPTLLQLLEKTEADKTIVKLINAVFTKFGEIKNNASENLNIIRTESAEKRKRFKEIFDKTLIHYRNLGVLNEINESEIDGVRVLAVSAMYKKRVKGTVRGMSKTGSILFMEPENVKKLTRELQILTEEEKKEIRLILQQLTFQISEYKPLLQEYQKHLFNFDRIQAKAKYAVEIDAILPEINSKKQLILREAFHPILYLNNKNNNENTIPQSLSLSKKQKIIAISGPNAGGKSITLKTIGLLQLMFQNGILVPVHPKSSMCFFKEILTDIGDNQSIENHLSTYSARLQKMSTILPKANQDTLILIDEFGTGSDPELGGALAESFLEYLYFKQSYCVVTTHYTNLKIKVEQLKNAINASMLFDKETLSPLYVLEVGQAGSSFTFEVAQKNKIPKKLIEVAKTKILSGTMNLESTLVKIQQEKFEIEKLKTQLTQRVENSEKKHSNIEETENKLLDKLTDFKELYAVEQKKLTLGKKLETFINNYNSGTSKKEIIKGFVKILEQEKFKNVKDNTHSQKKKKLSNTQQKLKKDLHKKEEKLEQKIEQKQQQKRVEFKTGMRVKIKESSTVGTIDKLEKEKAVINYGSFTTKISIFEIEKV